MKNPRLRFSLFLAFILLITAGQTALAQDSIGLGTWKLNLAKSKYDPGPPPKSESRLYEPWEKDGVKATFAIVQADGTRATFGYSAHYDGKDYKYTGSPDYDTIALKRVDANTNQATLKKDGKVVQTAKVVLSAGGKVRTLTLTGTTATGQKVNNVMVFDKQ